MLKRLWDCLTVWWVPPTSLDGAQAIISHAGGENLAGEPGLINEFLASRIRELYHQLKIPVIVQGELKACLRDIPLVVSLRQAESAPNYLSSLDIALWHKAECDKIGAKKVVLVTYYPHYWRALKTTEKVGLTVLVPSGLKEVLDPNNSQWWGRNKWVNRLYELCVARPYFFLKGWV